MDLSESAESLERQRYPHQHGWQRERDGQHLCREVVAAGHPDSFEGIAVGGDPRLLSS